MIYFSELNNHIRDKAKEVLDLWSYATKKKLNDSAGVDRSSLVAKTNSIALKTKADMLDLDTLLNVSTGLWYCMSLSCHVRVSEWIQTL